MHQGAKVHTDTSASRFPCVQQHLWLLRQEQERNACMDPLKSLACVRLQHSLQTESFPGMGELTVLELSPGCQLVMMSFAEFHA